MKRPRTYKMPHRRRREGRTDYHARLRLLKARKPRLVIRRSSSSLTCQLIAHDSQGDKTLVTATSANLRPLGWKAHGGSIPAAYLVGLLCGSQARKKGLKEAVADLGVQRSTNQSSLYAALKGAVDGGLEIPHSPQVLPSEQRIKGNHIASYAGKLKKEAPEKYGKLFSAYLRNSLPPEQLPAHVEEIRKKIK